MQNWDSFLGFLKGGLYTMFMFLDIDQGLFNILLVLMVVDTITGLMKVLRIDKTKFSFKVLLWGLSSKIGLLIVPLVVALMLKGVGEDMGFGVSLIIRILMVSEFLSITGNIYTVKTGKPVKDIDVFSMLFRFLRCKALKLVSKYTGNNIYSLECEEMEAKDKEEEEAKIAKEKKLDEKKES